MGGIKVEIVPPETEYLARFVMDTDPTIGWTKAYRIAERMVKERRLGTTAAPGSPDYYLQQILAHIGKIPELKDQHDDAYVDIRLRVPMKLIRGGRISVGLD